jgi:transposase-like protein
MKSGDDVLMMPAAARVEVFTGRGRRRRWSTDLKAQIVEDSYSTSVSAAAYR